MAVKVKVNTINVSVFVTAYPGRGSHRAFARGSDGRLWIAYRGATDGYIWAAYSADGGRTWTEEQVSASVYQNAAGGVILMIDSADVPHIIWHYYTGTERIEYASRATGSWVVETVYTSGGIISDVSACIDSANGFHIAFEESTIVYYVTGIAGSWSAKETIDADGLGPTDITVDSTNIPFVVYWATPATVAGFYMKHRTGGVWSAIEQISSVTQTVGSPSIAMDSSDNLHAAWNGDGYLNDLGKEVRYRKRTGGSWGTDTQIKKVPDDGVSRDMGPPLLLLDSDDNPWIVYQERYPPAENGGDESVYYKKITNGAVGGQVLIDSSIIRPGNYSSVFAGLWQRYNSSPILGTESSSIVGSEYHPVVALSHEITGATAEIYFEAADYVPRVQFYQLTIKGLHIPYEDLDGTKELHVVLKNLSPTSKLSGVDGEVVVRIGHKLAA